MRQSQAVRLKGEAASQSENISNGETTSNSETILHSEAISNMGASLAKDGIDSDFFFTDLISGQLHVKPACFGSSLYG